MDKKAGIGELSCKVCGQQFQTGINCELQPCTRVLTVYTCCQRLTIRLSDLSAGVDVYSDWIDACDSVAKEAAYVDGNGGGPTYQQNRTLLAQAGRGPGLPERQSMEMNSGALDDDIGDHGNDA